MAPTMPLEAESRSAGSDDTWRAGVLLRGGTGGAFLGGIMRSVDDGRWRWCAGMMDDGGVECMGDEELGGACSR